MGRDFIGVGVGGLIVSHGRALLVLRRRPPEAGCWSVPGGRIELGERMTDALARELREELGVEVRVGRLLCVSDHIADGEHWLAPAFHVEVVSGEPANREPDKHAELRWHPLDDLPENITATAANAVGAWLGKNTEGTSCRS